MEQLTVDLEQNGEWWYYKSPDYKPGFIAEMKACIPSDMRDWIPSTQTWAIHDDYADLLEELLVEWFWCKVNRICE